MSDLDPKAQALLDSVRGMGGPTRRDKARVKRRLLARVTAAMLAATAGASATTTAAAVGTAATGLWSAKLLVVAVAASVLVAGAATGVVASRQHARRRVVVTATSATGALAVREPVTPPFIAAPVPKILAAPVATEEVVAPKATGQFTARRSAAHAAVAPMPLVAGARETLEQELPLLQSAQEALRRGDIDRALGLLDEHAKRFPAGALAEERRAAHALASCRKTGSPSARAEAEAFLRDSPSSPLVESVREACLLAEP
jgi:hypothetical protein